MSKFLNVFGMLNVLSGTMKGPTCEWNFQYFRKNPRFDCNAKLHEHWYWKYQCSCNLALHSNRGILRKYWKFDSQVGPFRVPDSTLNVLNENSLCILYFHDSIQIRIRIAYFKTPNRICGFLKRKIRPINAFEGSKGPKNHRGAYTIALCTCPMR